MAGRPGGTRVEESVFQVGWDEHTILLRALWPQTDITIGPSIGVTITSSISDR